MISIEPLRVIAASEKLGFLLAGVGGFGLPSMPSSRLVMFATLAN